MNKKEFNNRIEYLNKLGQLHRVNGPAVEWVDGTKSWWINGKLHREDGPAIELSDGSKIWYIHGELHRIDGPAIECPNGAKEWYINGKKLTESEYTLLRFVKNE